MAKKKVPVKNSSNEPVKTSSIDSTIKIQVYRKDFINAIKFAKRFTDPNSTRFALANISISFTGIGVYIVATDGHMLYAYRIDSTPYDERKDFMLSPEQVKMILATKIKDNELDLRFVTSKGKNTLHIKDRKFESPEGRYPRWEQTIPSDSNCPDKFLVSQSDLVAIYHPVQIKTTISSKGAESTVVRKIMPVEGADKLHIGTKYVHSFDKNLMLRALEEDENTAAGKSKVTWRPNNTSGACIIEYSDKEFVLIMPMDLKPMD